MNLLLETRRFASPWRCKSGNIADIIHEDVDGFYYAELVNTWKQSLCQDIDLELGNYTLSFYARADKRVMLECKNDTTNNQVFNYQAIDSAEWKRYIVHFRVTVNNETTTIFSFLTRQAETPIYIKKIKLEQGTVYNSEWSAAPRDIITRSELESLAARVAALEAKL